MCSHDLVVHTCEDQSPQPPVPSRLPQRWGLGSKPTVANNYIYINLYLYIYKSKYIYIYLYIYIYVCMEVSINGVTPPNGWFIMENPINKLRIWGYLHFRKPPYEYMYVNGRWTILPSHNQNIVMYTYTFTSLFLARHSSKGGELSWMATLNISVWESSSI